MSRLPLNRLSTKGCRHAFLAAATFTVLVLAAPAARAWTPLDSCWPVWSAQPSPYHINSAGYSRIPFATVESIFGEAMAEWARPCCSSWDYRYMGTTSGRATDGANSQNIFSFAESSWPGELGDPTATLAVTLTTWWSGCENLTADMVFNAENHTFGTAHSVSTVDLLAVTTHEVGHWLGLGHSRVAGATMWPTYTDESDRSLHPDDETAVCSLYPGDCGCDTDRDCDDGYVCVGGACEQAPCASDDDCASGLECNVGTGECVAPPCRSDSDCPGAQVCDAGSCVLDADCPTCLPCTSIDDCGGGDWQCASDGISGFCTRICNASSDCPGNSECFGIEDESFSICLNDDADTAGLCPGDYVCLDESVPDPCDGVSCGAGEVCDDGDCVPVGGDDGCIVCDSCEDDGDCPGGGCFSFDGTTTVCAPFCEDSSDCPPNTECFGFSSGGESVNLCMNADLDSAGACPVGFSCEAADPCDGVSCPDGQTCDPGTGDCVGGTPDAGTPDSGSPDTGGSDTGVGADTGVPPEGCTLCRACASDAECAQGTCETIGAAGTFCTIDCSGGADLCPGNTTCFDVSIGEENRSYCLNDNAAAAGICPIDFECIDETNVGGDDVGGTGDDTGTTPAYYPGLGADDGCSCSSNPSPAAPLGWMLVLALGFVRRRSQR